MACNVDNNAFELSITPSRKRKHNFEEIPPTAENKENLAFINNVCLEEKSISEIVQQKKLSTQENGYEVIRKPPKKKKKSDIEKSCFVNPALNLNMPEKKFNPFEVKRPSPVVTKINCFVNAGLNIRTEDNNACFNPFEISREKCLTDLKQGIENPALELPKTLAIALPFTPNIGCRIDFSKMQLSTLTPSKLLEEKLVFSPIPKDDADSEENSKSRRSLSVISEEIDIGKELDCYQLELENSINEAKSKKGGGGRSKRSFGARLAEIEETETENMHLDGIENTTSEMKEGNARSNSDSNPVTKEKIENEDLKTREEDEKNNDIEFDDRESEDEDFKKPAPFVRCYRKANSMKKQTIVEDHDKIKKEKKTVANVIRKSFRNIIHSVKSQDAKTTSKGDNEQKTNPDFFETIRQSLRIKKLKERPEEITKDADSRDISIIDNSERKIFRSSSLDGITATEDSHKKFTFRASLRRSSKCVYKTLKKNTENYNLKK